MEARQKETTAATDRALVARHAGALLDDGFSFVDGNPEVTRRIEGRLALAGDRAIRGTPSFAFKDMMLRGCVPIDVLREQAEKDRAADRRRRPCLASAAISGLSSPFAAAYRKGPRDGPRRSWPRKKRQGPT